MLGAFCVCIWVVAAESWLFQLRNKWLSLYYKLGLPGGTSGKEPASQYRRPWRLRFDPWVGKISWRRAWQPTPVFLPGESHGQRSLEIYSPWGCRVICDWSNWAHKIHFSQLVYFLGIIFYYIPELGVQCYLPMGHIFNLFGSSD